MVTFGTHTGTPTIVVLAEDAGLGLRRVQGAGPPHRPDQKVGARPGARSRHIPRVERRPRRARRLSLRTRAAPAVGADTHRDRCGLRSCHDRAPEGAALRACGLASAYRAHRRRRSPRGGRPGGRAGRGTDPEPPGGRRRSPVPGGWSRTAAPRAPCRTGGHGLVRRATAPGSARWHTAASGSFGPRGWSTVRPGRKVGTHFDAKSPNASLMSFGGSRHPARAARRRLRGALGVLSMRTKPLVS